MRVNMAGVWRDGGEGQRGIQGGTALQFPAEGAVLEGGEEGVEFGEVGALPGLLPIHGFHDGGESALEGKRGKNHFYSTQLRFGNIGHRASSATGKRLDVLSQSRHNQLLPHEDWLGSRGF